MSTLDTWREQARRRAEPLMARYRELQPRERLLVSVAAVVVTITLLFLLVWEPLAKAREKSREALSDERALAQRLEVIGAAVQKARAAGVGAIQGREQSLLTLVDALGKNSELGKAPTRLQPEGEQEVRVVFEDVSFDALMRWVALLENTYGIRVTAADFERRAGAGLVNARLTVRRS